MQLLFMVQVCFLWTGFKYGTKTCCGYGGGDHNYNPKILCGNMLASACAEPREYVSWDGIHFTEAANKIVANAILNGSLFDPPFPLHEHCDLKPIVWSIASSQRSLLCSNLIILKYSAVKLLNNVSIYGVLLLLPLCV